MFLARIRTGDGVVPVARLSDDTLLRLDTVDGIAGDDLVELLDSVGLEKLEQLVKECLDDGTTAGRVVPVAEAHFEVPVARPQKIVCLALNYAAHAEEGDLNVPQAPVIFFKPPSSLVAHQRPVRCPQRSTRIDFEVELAVVIGRECRNVAESDWRSVVLGYTVLNDMTARDVQLDAMGRNEPWDHSKGFDTLAPCGPYLVTADEIDDPMDLDLSLSIGDRVLQSSNTRHMVFSIPQMIADITDGITLVPGDIIATGTPSGIGPVTDGEVMHAYVEGVGSLVNPAVYPAPEP